MPNQVLVTASTYSHIRNFHLPYLKAFYDAGWTVDLACPAPPATLPYVRAAYDVAFTKRMSALENFRACGRLRRLIAQNSYDLVVTHTSLAAFFTRLAMRGMKCRPRVVNVVHGYLFDETTPFQKRQALLWAEKLTAPVTDLILTMNEDDYVLASKHRLGQKVHNIPGIGIDFSRLPQGGRGDGLRRAHGIPNDAFCFIYAAEFSQRKNQALLLHALAELPPHLWLLLPGDGAELDSCRQLAQSLGIENRVVFPGHVSDVPAWLCAADAAVSSSYSEGLPFNIMEAMHYGLSVAASDVKGHRDLIDDGQTGLLFASGSVDDCRRQLLRLSEDATLRSALSARASTQLSMYDLDHVLPIVMDHYGVAAVSISSSMTETSNAVRS